MDRQKIENAIEALIALLDHIDGDENLECTGDDEFYLAGASTDREGDRSEDEPYLAAIGQTWRGDIIIDIESGALIVGGGCGYRCMMDV